MKKHDEKASIRPIMVSLGTQRGPSESIKVVVVVGVERVVLSSDMMDISLYLSGESFVDVVVVDNVH